VSAFFGHCPCAPKPPIVGDWQKQAQAKSGNPAQSIILNCDYKAILLL